MKILETTYPLNEVTYNAEDAEIYNSTRTSGVFAGNDFTASVTGQDTNVTISEGLGWIKDDRFSGKAIAMKEPAILTFEKSESTLDRIDSIVLRFSRAEKNTKLVVVKGTPSGSPSPTMPIRSGGIYELHLYHVFRRAGSVAITETDITDLRKNKLFCGIMQNAVTGVEQVAGSTSLGFENIGMQKPAEGNELNSILSFISDTINPLPVKLGGTGSGKPKETLTIAPASSSLKDENVQLYVIRFLNMAFVRGFAVSSKRLSAGSTYNLGKLSSAQASYKPKNNTGLSFSCIKNGYARITTGGEIEIKPSETVDTGTLMYVSGFYVF